MAIVYMLLSFFIGLLLETTVFSRLSIYGAKPDFILILIVLIAVKKGSMTGQIFGFIGGLMQDCLSYGVLGVQAMVKAITGFGSGFLQNKLEENNLLLIMILVFIVTIASGFLGALAKTFFTAVTISVSFRWKKRISSSGDPEVPKVSSKPSMILEFGSNSQSFGVQNNL